MRLLYRSQDGFHLTKNLSVKDKIPPYAILSHTWGKDDEEVTFQDIVECKDEKKPGYGKLQGCVGKAADEGYQYSWIDTCCSIQTHH